MDTLTWQPIETAPMRNSVLVCFWNHDVLIAMRDDVDGSDGFYCAHVGKLNRPTHWMPLPNPPSSPSSEHD
jgi:hypothetical protein